MRTFPSLPTGSLQSLPLGTRIPPSVHAVTCSLPTMRDVIGYEEKNPETLAAMKTGYPRFVTHFYIEKIAKHWIDRFNLKESELLFSSSPSILQEVLRQAEDPNAVIIESDGFAALQIPASSPGLARAKSCMQHIGGGISSRLAERYLLDHQLIESAEPEERGASKTAENDVRKKIARLFESDPKDVFLANSGMNAFYAVFREISEIQKRENRKNWIQLGWLYLDTIEILTKFTGGERIYFSDVLDLDRLENYLKENGNRVAGLVTEIPTNPLLQTTDLIRLRELCRRHDFPLIVDPTLATPYNINLLPHCDVAVNSLTKYAASRGDVLLGAAILNRKSRWADQLNLEKSEWLVPPFSADLERLAFEISDYEAVTEKINRNAMALADFLENHPSVEKIFSPHRGVSGENYRALERRPNSPGGLITISLRKPLADFYDRIELPKGPSFGALFTLLCPFIYLAHYDLVSTEVGRQKLAASQIDPELVRISVGTEDPAAILAAFENAL